MLWSRRAVLLVSASATAAIPLAAQGRVTRATAPSVAPSVPAPADLSVEPGKAFNGALKWRNIGPVRGGRVTTVTGIRQEPFTFYIGSTGGGVWKTTDAGTTWNNVSDGYFGCASMGALDVADSDPSVVYAGTGSDGIRSNISLGCGVYRSANAGKSWQFIGLKGIGQIGAVVVHPTNPDIVWVAAIGDPFKSTAQRGVYKTIDGGKNWKQVLFVSDSTGASDIELKPGDPSVVYATMWRGQRKPWTIISGARGEGGVYRSADGGETWTKITAGLPNDLIGKGDLAVSPADPNRVYVLLEANPGQGVYRSDDAGLTWKQTSANTPLVYRAFYYLNIDADPTNADIVYVNNETLFKSTDGGKSFRGISTPHGDNHDMWINPSNPAIWVQSNDGGANVTLNGGATWSTQYNQPTAEVYQVAVDERYPYRVYGAQQDQGATHVIPSLPLTASRVDDPLMQWYPAGGCETGPAVPSAADPDVVYASCKGQFSRFNVKTGQEQQYWVGAQSLYGNDPKDLLYRFQRVSPLVRSIHDPKAVYYGSQYVHRSRDEGRSWERISPDLTANDPATQGLSGFPITRDITGEEFYSTLYAIAESPVEKGVIWAGANDGPISVSRDDGKTWTRVTPAGLPAGGRVQTIAPSPHRKGSAYVAVLRHLLGDYQPYVYKTTDYGATWTRLTTGRNGVPDDHPTRVVREDPARPGLLYLGTEYGFFVSLDDGAHWRDFRMNLPVVPVTDIVVHRRDLVISTQGRAVWVLDDITPLLEVTTAVVEKPLHLFKPKTAIRYRYSGFPDRPEFPQYPPPGAAITYSLASAVKGPVTLEVLDSTGTVVRSFTSGPAAPVAPPAPGSVGVPMAPPEVAEAPEGGPRGARPGVRLTTAAGITRVTWDFTLAGPLRENSTPEPRGGPQVLPGRYRVRLSADGMREEQPLEILADPRVFADRVTLQDLRAQFALATLTRNAVGESRVLLGRLKARRDALAASGNVAGAGSLIAKMIEDLETAPGRYQTGKLIAQWQYLYGLVTAADQLPGKDAYERFTTLRQQLDAVQRRANAVLTVN